MDKRLERLEAKNEALQLALVAALSMLKMGEETPADLVVGSLMRTIADRAENDVLKEAILEIAAALGDEARQ